MPYDAKAVANYLLDLAERDETTVTPMKLQKLVYYAHGWHLAYTDEPLIDEQVECWPYGPVVDSLFHEFKEFGGQAIARRATEIKVVRSPETRNLVVKSVKPELPDDAREAKSIIRAVWEAYGKYSGIRLSNMTHETGSPWHQTYERYRQNPPKGTDIPEEVIKAHFLKLRGDD